MLIKRDKSFVAPLFSVSPVAQISVKIIRCVKRAEENQKKKNKKNYEGTSFTTVKEIFVNSSKEYADRTFLLEKLNPKGEWT